MFRIGEFSIIAQVSGRLLRYYDEIGLLKPEHTDPQTGYRFYSARQLPRLNRILAAKELGFSLEQIARLLKDDVSTEELRGMLTLRKAQIERSVQEETQRLLEVESRLQQIEAHGQVNEPDVVLKSIPPQRFLSVREVLPNLEAVRSLVQHMYAVVPKAVSSSHLGHIAIVVHFPAYDPEALDFEVGYLLMGNAPASVQLSEDRTLMLRELPAFERAATLVHVGPISEVHRSYGTLAEWLEAHDWQLNGPGRQVMMQLPMQARSDEAMVELQMPVQRPGQHRA